MNNALNRQSAYIPSLNGLRALSVIFVILHHYNTEIFRQSISFPFSFLIFDGFLGVNVFFVISGYLITALLMQEKQKTGAISLKKFYIRRALRIFPAYYFLLFVYLILQLCNIFHLSTMSWVTSLTFTKYFHMEDWQTNHFWSLSVEEHFYLLWPLFFKTRKKYNLLFIIIAVVALIRLLNNGNYNRWFNPWSIFERADALAMGCLLALYYEKIKLFIDNLVQKSRLFCFLPLLVLFILYLADQVDLFAKNNIHFVTAAVGQTYGTIANGAIVMIIVISINYKNWWYKFLNLPAMNFIGKISYSLYLWQQLFFTKSLGLFATFPVSIICTVLMALFSYYVIERPCLALKNKFEV